MGVKGIVVSQSRHLPAGMSLQKSRGPIAPFHPNLVNSATAEMILDLTNHLNREPCMEGLTCQGSGAVSVVSWIMWSLRPYQLTERLQASDPCSAGTPSRGRSSRGQAMAPQVHSAPPRQQRGELCSVHGQPLSLITANPRKRFNTAF